MIETQAIVEAIVSHAAASGHFERVNAHEPKNSPGSGVTAAAWVQRLAPVALASGLAVTSALLVVNVRLYTPLLQEPLDAVDPNMVGAADALIAAYSGDFTLDGLVRNVDLLGAHGTPLSAEAGYLEQDKKMFRVMTLTVPLVINDAWEQNA